MARFLSQVYFTFRLRLASDLHVGTGEFEKLRVLRPNAHLSDADPEVALVARDHAELPAIPATAIKGAVRRHLEEWSPVDVPRLLGEIKFTEEDDSGRPPKESGQSGIVLFHYAKMVSSALTAAADDPSLRPFWDSAKHTFIATHVAIDRKTRTAVEHKLFYVEQVPAGTVFEATGVVLAGEAEAKAALQKVLGAFASEGGAAIGADERLGAGRLVLDGEVSCSLLAFNPATANIESRSFRLRVPPQSTKAARTAHTWTITLTCRGPYLTIDASHDRKSSNTIAAARSGRSNSVLPSLPASSLMGALRARAAWLAAVENATAELPNGSHPGFDDPERVLDYRQEPDALTRTERLFGVTGWRGLLRIEKLEAKAGTFDKDGYTSVAIDRFTGATLDSALYSIQYFVDSEFEVTLALEQRGTWPKPDDLKLVQALLCDAKDDGLRLGHGSGRGYGWFDVDGDIGGAAVRAQQAHVVMPQAQPAVSAPAGQSLSAPPQPERARGSGPAQKHAYGTVKSGKPPAKKGKKR